MCQEPANSLAESPTRPSPVVSALPNPFVEPDSVKSINTQLRHGLPALSLQGSFNPVEVSEADYGYRGCCVAAALELHQVFRHYLGGRDREEMGGDGQEC